MFSGWQTKLIFSSERLHWQTFTLFLRRATNRGRVIAFNPTVVTKLLLVVSPLRSERVSTGFRFRRK